MTEIIDDKNLIDVIRASHAIFEKSFERYDQNLTRYFRLLQRGILNYDDYNSLTYSSELEEASTELGDVDVMMKCLSLLLPEVSEKRIEDVGYHELEHGIIAEEWGIRNDMQISCSYGIINIREKDENINYMPFTMFDFDDQPFHKNPQLYVDFMMAQARHSDPAEYHGEKKLMSMLKTDKSFD